MGSKLHPELMTPAERLEEIGQILSQGLFRLCNRIKLQYSSDLRDNSLDFSAKKSVHGKTII